MAPAFVDEALAAALRGMSVNGFREWQKVDPAAPKPHWFGRCKRYKVSELIGASDPQLGHNGVPLTPVPNPRDDAA